MRRAWWVEGGRKGGRAFEGDKELDHPFPLCYCSPIHLVCFTREALAVVNSPHAARKQSKKGRGWRV